MVTALLCLLAALWIPGLYLLVVSVRRAPVAVEDENGFHVIEQPVMRSGMLGAPVRIA